MIFVFISYLLFIDVLDDVKIEVNGWNLFVRKGKYIYVGSALKNIDKRIERHIKSSKGLTEKKHWHIDYFLSDEKVFLKDFSKFDKKECDLSQEIFKAKKVLPVFLEKENKKKGFGNSDCNVCKSHLYFKKI